VTGSQSAQELHLGCEAVAVFRQAPAAWPIEDATLTLEVLFGRVFPEGCVDIDAKGIAGAKVSAVERLEGLRRAVLIPGLRPAGVEHLGYVLFVLTGRAAGFAAGATLEKVRSLCPREAASSGTKQTLHHGGGRGGLIRCG
jgi:hypothetical protein